MGLAKLITSTNIIGALHLSFSRSAIFNAKDKYINILIRTGFVFEARCGAPEYL